MFCASYVYLFNLCWTGFTSPQPIVGRVYPSTLAFYPSKGRVDGSLDEAVGSVTGDGYLEITPVVGTDVRVSPSKVVITLVTTDRLLRDHRRLVFTRHRREQLLQCITFSVICVRLTDSAANVDAARTTSS